MELYYNAVAILTYRQKLSSHNDRTKPSFIRQELAATRIYAIASSGYGHDFPPLPILPYALSLSMSVQYQQLRWSKPGPRFQRAKSTLEACCSLLERLGKTWCSAEAMARLGRRALRQIENAAREHGRSARDSRPESPSPLNESPQSPASMALHVPVEAMRASKSSTANSLRQPAYAGVPPTITKAAPEATAAADLMPEDEGFHLGDVGTLDPGMFADIDTLFGDFMDLSLPTNFWDPIFCNDVQGENGGAL